MNLKQLLALPLAFAVAWALAFPLSHRPVAYDWSRALNDVKFIAFELQHQLGTDSGLSADVLHRWLDRSSTPDDPPAVLELPAPGLDPWGNAYQLGERRDRDGNRTHGIYSLGRDGRSESGGDDPDDINSWSIDPVAFYLPEATEELKVRQAKTAIPWFVVIYGLMSFVLRTRKSGGAEVGHR